MWLLHLLTHPISLLLPALKVSVKPSDRTVKQLLGELYSDRQYLEELLEDPAFITLEDQHKPESGKKKSLPSFVTSGIKYLDARCGNSVIILDQLCFSALSPTLPPTLHAPCGILWHTLPSAHAYWMLTVACNLML